MFSIGKTKINEFQASKWSYNEVIFGVKTKPTEKIIVLPIIDNKYYCNYLLSWPEFSGEGTNSTSGELEWNFF
jgi:hypothetical protein